MEAADSAKLRGHFYARATAPLHLRLPRLAAELSVDRRIIWVDERLDEGSFKYGPFSKRLTYSRVFETRYAGGHESRRTADNVNVITPSLSAPNLASSTHGSFSDDGR